MIKKMLVMLIVAGMLMGAGGCISTGGCTTAAVVAPIALTYGSIAVFTLVLLEPEPEYVPYKGPIVYPKKYYEASQDSQSSAEGTEAAYL